MVLKTKEVEIEYEGAKHKVTLKKLTFGERNQLMEECTDMKFIGGTPHIKVSNKNMREISLLKSIVSAPFPKTIQGIQDLDYEAGEILYAAFEEVNSVSDKKNDKSASS